MMRFILPVVGLALGFATIGCTPGSCGDVTLTGVQPNADIEAYRNADGSIGLQELCGTDYGAYALSRSDTRITTLILSPNVPGADLEGDLHVNRVILPAASVVFWNAHLVAGKTLTMANLSGGGLHKFSEPDVYSTFPLSAASLTFLEGPMNRREETIIDTVDWSEEWRVHYSFEFSGYQTWEGEDTIKRSRGTEVGTEAFVPPDPEPTGS